MNNNLKNRLLIATMFVGSFVVSFPALAADDLTRGFTAECTNTGVQAFRDGVGPNGQPLGRGWSKGEKFRGSPWVFRWTPPNKLTVDGRELLVTGMHGGSLTATLPGRGLATVNLYSYAINVPLKAVVYAQVQATELLGLGVKTRAAAFDCAFSFVAD